MRYLKEFQDNPFASTYSIIWWYIMIGFLLILGVVYFLWWYFFTWASEPSQKINNNLLKVWWYVCNQVSIAASPQERQQWLMFVESMADDACMLFVFQRSWAHNFRMKNTLIPLDMLRIDNNLRIIHIEENVQPCPSELWNWCPTYGPDWSILWADLALYVLEINWGLVETSWITVGDTLNYPFMSWNTIQ